MIYDVFLAGHNGMLGRAPRTSLRDGIESTYRYFLSLDRPSL